MLISKYINTYISYIWLPDIVWLLFLKIFCARCEYVCVCHKSEYFRTQFSYSLHHKSQFSSVSLLSQHKQRRGGQDKGMKARRRIVKRQERRVGASQYPWNEQSLWDTMGITSLWKSALYRISYHKCVTDAPAGVPFPLVFSSTSWFLYHPTSMLCLYALICNPGIHLHLCNLHYAETKLNP